MSKLLCEHETNTPDHIMICGEPYEHHVDGILGHEFVTSKKVGPHLGNPCILCGRDADEQYPYGCEKWYRPEEWRMPTPLVYMIRDEALTLERAVTLLNEWTRLQVDRKFTGEEWEAFDEMVDFTPPDKLYKKMVDFVQGYSGLIRGYELWYEIKDKAFQVVPHTLAWWAYPKLRRYMGKMEELIKTHAPDTWKLIEREDDRAKEALGHPEVDWRDKPETA